MRRTIGRPGLILAVIAALLGGGAAPAIAAWEPTRTLRNVPGGELLSVADMAGLGRRAVVGWQEEGSPRRAYLRWSTDSGSSWGSITPLDGGARRELAVDTCGAYAWAVSGLRVAAAPAGEWLVVLDGFEMDGPVVESSLLTLLGQARKPDIACAGGRRLAVAWLQKVGGSHRLKVFTRALFPVFTGSAAQERSFDLGKANLRRGLAVAATKDRIHVAWFTGIVLKHKSFRVGGAPDFGVTPLPTRSLGSFRYGFAPKLGAAGRRVVLAMMNRADLVARVSSDRGGSWGPQRTLLDEPFPSEIGAGPTNADVRGRRLLVSGVEIGGFETLDGRGFLYESPNGGRSWARVKGSLRRGSAVVGAYLSPGASTKAAMAWDDSLGFEAGMGPQSLRFRRQS
jgi:hypothetical protein